MLYRLYIHEIHLFHPLSKSHYFNTLIPVKSLKASIYVTHVMSFLQSFIQGQGMRSVAFGHLKNNSSTQFFICCHSFQILLSKHKGKKALRAQSTCKIQFQKNARHTPDKGVQLLLKFTCSDQLVMLVR